MSGQHRFHDVRRQAGLAAVVALPPFFLFASVGEIERGLVGTLLAYITVSALQLGWHHRQQIWFWCIASAMMVAGILQVFAVAWPKLDTGMATIYAAAGANALAWLMLFALAALLARDMPHEAPIRCRVCGLPTEKGSVHCGHCGEWSPAPVPAWPVAITVTPVVLVVVALIVF